MEKKTDISITIAIRQRSKTFALQNWNAGLIFLKHTNFGAKCVPLSPEQSVEDVMCVVSFGSKTSFRDSIKNTAN